MIDIQANVVSPHALGDGLHLVALSLGGQPHRGHQLLLLPLDLLVLDLNLLPPLYNLHKLRIIPLFSLYSNHSVRIEKKSHRVGSKSRQGRRDEITMLHLYL